MPRGFCRAALLYYLKNLRKEKAARSKGGFEIFGIKSNCACYINEQTRSVYSDGLSSGSPAMSRA